MNEVLATLIELAKEGRLEVEGVTLSNSGYDIELGQDAEHFEGTVCFRVKIDADVITFGNMLSESMK